MRYIRFLFQNFNTQLSFAILSRFCVSGKLGYGQTQMRGYLGAEETELLALTDSALGKLRGMSNTEYAALDLYPDFDVETESQS